MTAQRLVTNGLCFGLACLVLFSACFLQAAEQDFQVQPLFTRLAETATKVTLDSTFRYFQGVEMEEADEFDGWGVDADLTVPFYQRFQIRLILPVYTKGEARLLKPPTKEDFNIKGTAGIFDFPSLIFEHQFLTEKDHGFNAGYFAGVGWVEAGGIWHNWGKLRTTHGDVYNHVGSVALFGLKADSYLNEKVRLVGNLGGRYYWRSDDLNPARDGDSFFLIDAAAAGVFHPWNARVYPVAELVYRGDVQHYNSLLLVPQIIVPVCPNFEAKLGIPVGLTGDGERWGLRVQLTGRF